MTVNLRKTLGFWLSFYLFSNYSQRSKLTGQYRFRSYQVLRYEVIGGISSQMTSDKVWASLKHYIAEVMFELSGRGNRVHS